MCSDYPHDDSKKSSVNVEIVDFKTEYNQMLLDALKIWKTCPKEDGSLDSVLITTTVDNSGLGNQVWAYLSVWAVARRYGIRPVMQVTALNRLSKIFQPEHFNIPSMKDVGVKCNIITWMLEQNYDGALVITHPKAIFPALQQPAKKTRTLIKSMLYVVDAYNAVPLWNELKTDLVIRDDLRREADQRLRDIRRDFYNSLLEEHSFQNLKLSDIEFVSVHVRSSEYVYHLQRVYKNSNPVDENFYINAFSWLKNQVKNKVLMFLVITDDLKWAREKLAKNRPDVFLPGSGAYHDPYLDMTILASCNHSIFAYGTFGLTGALLAQGGYTIVYDIGNGSVTKEMQFASALPRWYIMDKKGNLQYENEIFNLTFRSK